MNFHIEEFMVQEMIKHPGFKYVSCTDPKLDGLPLPVHQVDLKNISNRFYERVKQRRDLEATASMAKITLNTAILSALIQNPKEEATARYGCCGFMGLLETDEKRDHVNRYYVSDQRIWNQPVFYHNGGLVWVKDRMLNIHLN